MQCIGNNSPFVYNTTSIYTPEGALLFGFSIEGVSQYNSDPNTTSHLTNPKYKQLTYSAREELLPQLSKMLFGEKLTFKYYGKL